MYRSSRRLLPVLCAIAVLAPAAASAGESSTVSHSDAVRALQAAESAFASPLSSGGGSPSRDATLALRDLAVALPALDGADRRRGTALLRRPTDRGRGFFGREAAASPTCNANFCIHWTNVKQNAPGSSKFVDQVVAATDQSYAVENGTLAWKRARSDGMRGARKGVGGEGQVDVYITNLGRNLYGYAAPDPGQGGARRFAYLVLDNTYTGFPSSPIESLNVTVAHEYNHILQFNYDTLEDVWMFESSAVWAEEKVFPEINDYLNYIKTYAGKSRLPLTTEDFQIYSEGVWNHWLDSHYGSDVVRDAWSASEAGVKPPHLATAAYDASIKAHGGESFSAEFGAFAAGTAEWNSSTFFPDAAAYRDIKRKGTLRSRPTTAALDNTTFRLIDVEPTNAASLTLKVKASAGTASAIALVGRQGPIDAGTVTTALQQMPRGGRGAATIADPASFDRITAVIANTDGTTRRGRYVGDGSAYRYSLAK